MIKINDLILIMLFILILNGSLLNAQTEKEIKLSGNYFWGEAEGKSVDQAKSSALQEMLFKIQVTVSADLTSKSQEHFDFYC